MSHIIYFAPGLKPVLKHGNHDQSTHGNWADGSVNVSELSKDDYLDIVYSAKTVEEAYTTIANRLGKNMKPQVADLSEDEINIYRGVQDVERDTQRLLEGKIKFTDFQTWGQGIYVTPSKQDASNYGEVLGLKLGSDAKILKGELEWEKALDITWQPSASSKTTSYFPFTTADSGGKWNSKVVDMSRVKMSPNEQGVPNYSVADLKNLYWASKGYDGFSPHGGEMVLFNGSQLTLNKNNPSVQKHLLGQHDQKTHGRWASSGLPHELEDVKGSLQKYIDAGLITKKSEVTRERKRFRQNPETGETEYVSVRENVRDTLGQDYSFREPDKNADPEGYEMFQEAQKKMLGGNAEEIELMARQEALDSGMSSRQALYFGQAIVSRAALYVKMENAIVMGETARKIYSRDVSDYAEKEYKNFFDTQAETIKIMGENIGKSNPVIAIETEDFLGVIKDGRFKTQYETRESNGAYRPALRKEAELALSGVPLDTKSSERPIYGYLALQEKGKTANTSPYNTDKWNINNGGVGQYGEVRVVLKDEARSRTSYTLVDSLDRYAIPQPLTATSKNDLVRAGAYHDLTASHGGYQRESYTEAQVYGGVKVSDIKAVYVVDAFDRPSKAQVSAIESAFSAKGIKIPVTLIPQEGRTLND